MSVRDATGKARLERQIKVFTEYLHRDIPMRLLEVHFSLDMEFRIDVGQNIQRD